MPKPGEKGGDDPKPVETETVSKAEFDAMMSKFEALETTNAELSNQLTTVTNDRDGLKGRVTEFEKDQNLAAKNERIAGWAERLADADDDTIQAFEDALTAKNGKSIVDIQMGHLKTTVVKPLEDQLAEKDRLLEAAGLQIRTAKLDVPATQLAALHFRDHPTAQNMGKRMLLDAITLDKDGNEAHTENFANQSHGGLDPEIGEAFTMEGYAKYLSATDTLLGKGSKLIVPGGEGDDTTVATSGAFKAARKSGDWGGVVDNLVGNLTKKEKPT